MPVPVPSTRIEATSTRETFYLLMFFKKKDVLLCAETLRLTRTVLNVPCANWVESYSRGV